MDLPILEEHNFKGLLRYYGVTQQEIAKGLKISQASINQQLSGAVKMKPKTEDFIAGLIEQLRKSRKQHSRKIQKA